LSDDSEKKLKGIPVHRAISVDMNESVVRVADIVDFLAKLKSVYSHTIDINEMLVQEINSVCTVAIKNNRPGNSRYSSG